MEDAIQALCQNFFEKLGADFSNLKVEKQTDSVYKIFLNSEDSHLIIGPHGKNLETISHLLKLLISKKSDGYINIHVEVNDYLQKKNEKLLGFIASKVEYVQKSGKEIILPFFTAYERKQVHSYVSDHGGNILTQSIGEGKDRRIHLSKKDSKMTIDIDGDDI